MKQVAITPGLITIVKEPLTREEVIARVSAPLLAEGFVKESYPQAILAREQNFPTGLPTEPVGVAIPHTDCEHVHRAGVAIGILRHPVTFRNMADPDESIEVKLLFMLAIDEPHGQIEMLQNLASIFQDAELLQTLVAAETVEEVWPVVDKTFQSLS